jgi:hypothetical protein
MFRLEETEIVAAVKRARELHPSVKIVRFGEYVVSGSKGARYIVKCYRDSEGFKTVDCSCKTIDGVACKHGVSALPLHIHMAASRRATSH